MLWTENAFNGCLGIQRGRQIKDGKQAQEGWIGEPAWFFSVCEWSSLLSAHLQAEHGPALLKLHCNGDLGFLSSQEHTGQLKSKEDILTSLIPLVVYFLPQPSPLYIEFHTSLRVQRWLISAVHFVLERILHAMRFQLPIIDHTPAKTLDFQFLQGS